MVPQRPGVGGQRHPDQCWELSFKTSSPASAAAWGPPLGALKRDWM